MNKKYFYLLIIVALLLSTTMTVFADGPTEIEPEITPPTIESGEITVEGFDYWFVEFSSPPKADGGKAAKITAEQKAFRKAAKKAPSSDGCVGVLRATRMPSRDAGAAREAGFLGQAWSAGPLLAARSYLKVCVLCAAVMLSAAGAAAQVTGKHAAIMADANNGAVLHADQADEPRYPASLTKIMTLFNRLCVSS